MNIRTDLAIEDVSNDGIYKKYKYSKVNKTVLDEEMAKKYKKNKGMYYTIETQAFRENNHDKEEEVEYIIKDILLEIFDSYEINFKDEIFVVGLGNMDVTPDALGPLVVDHIIVTKHLYILDELSPNMGVVSALKPGVMGQTGIETSDIIKAIVKQKKPKCLVVIDSLASRSLKRVASSIQISTGGINPGSGIGNNRKSISIDSIGIPVIAIGVPMVVDVKNLSNDIFEVMSDLDKKTIDNYFDKIDDYDHLDFFLTPKDVDKNILDLSISIANGINNAIHEI